MEAIKEQLGKVAITVEKDYWDIKKAYNRLVIVELKGQYKTYISRVPVPAGVSINNRDFWIPFSSLSEEASAKITAVYNKINYIESLVPTIEHLDDALLELNRIQGVNVIEVYYKKGVDFIGISSSVENVKTRIIYKDKLSTYNGESMYKALCLASSSSNSNPTYEIQWCPESGYKYTNDDENDVIGINLSYVLSYTRGGNPETAIAHITPHIAIMGVLYRTFIIKNVEPNS